MASESVLENILYFHVNDFIPTISDCHCLLECELSADYSVQQVTHTNLSPISPNFVWTEDSASKFQASLSSPEIKMRLSNLQNLLIDNSQPAIDAACNELSNILVSAASTSLKRKRYNKCKARLKK